MENEQKLIKAVDIEPFPLLFVTLSGAHLYGFPSHDSDYDLRGVHVLPCDEVLGLKPLQETISRSQKYEGLDIDLVTHDIKKYFLLLLKNNGYVLEQIYSPLVVHTSPEHEELKKIALGCITRNHSFHYLGFARNQWKLLENEPKRRVKRLLYLYRVILTGIHLMQTGLIEANLVSLNEKFRLPYIGDLIDKKIHGTEQETVGDADLDFHRGAYERLALLLQEEGEQSSLPEESSAKKALNDLLVRARLSTLER